MTTTPVKAPALSRLASVRLAAPAFAVALLAGSAFLRTRGIDGSLWMDEGLSIGIASHALLDIPGLLHQDGNPPLYYLLLHVWMDLVGDSEVQARGLSLLFALLCVPAGLWAGWSLFGVRAGMACAALAAVVPFLTVYAQEARMYSLVALLGLLASASFLHAFVYRRRRHAAVFGLLLALLLYTHSWGAFFAIGAVAALASVLAVTPERRGVVRDAALAFGGAAIAFLPWLPTLAHQAAHTGAPWSQPPRLGVPVQVSRWVFGGSGAAIALLLGGGAGLAAVARGRRSREATAVLSLVALVLVTLGVAWVFSQANPAWSPRYFGVIVGPLLLLAGLGVTRAGHMGLAALLLAFALSLKPMAHENRTKSNGRDVAAQVHGSLAPGDVILATQPEQLPAMRYYLPGPFRYATTLGPVRDARVMDWRDALQRLERARPAAALDPLLDRVRPGGHVLLVRPVTFGTENWEPPWTKLVRRRSAQWSRAVAQDRRFRLTAVAPTFYRRATLVAVSGTLFTKVADR